ncbi:hypothetical protein FACS189450_01800 [Spirochaetia bacterium]|nr:hypothetical protein FACS189450_01800 [Spirochaetia bacterium]
METRSKKPAAPSPQEIPAVPMGDKHGKAKTLIRLTIQTIVPVYINIDNVVRTVSMAPNNGDIRRFNVVYRTSIRRFNVVY